MPDPDPDDVDAREVDDDPWPTVAEIAEELRVNPATVRLWISKGMLPAMRARMRKLLVRRSDLDEMIGARRGPAPSEGYRPRPRFRGQLGPPQSLNQLSSADVHGREASPETMQAIAERLRRADEAWEQAQAASENVPPARASRTASAHWGPRANSRRDHWPRQAGSWGSLGRRSRERAT